MVPVTVYFLSISGLSLDSLQKRLLRCGFARESAVNERKCSIVLDDEGFAVLRRQNRWIKT